MGLIILMLVHLGAYVYVGVGGVGTERQGEKRVKVYKIERNCKRETDLKQND